MCTCRNVRGLCAPSALLPEVVVEVVLEARMMLPAAAMRCSTVALRISSLSSEGRADTMDWFKAVATAGTNGPEMLTLTASVLTCESAASPVSASVDTWSSCRKPAYCVQDIRKRGKNRAASSVLARRESSTLHEFVVIG